MKNKYFVLQGENVLEPREDVWPLFPLKGFCVGMKKEYSLEDIPDHSYVFANRLLDDEGISKFQELFPKIQQRMKGIFFEDLGILEILVENKSTLESILYASHALCSLNTVEAYLKEVSYVVLSNDLTLDEIKEIASFKTGVCLYGHFPIMYSRRKLISNYQEHFKLQKKEPFLITEPIHDQTFFLVENEYGTIVYEKEPFFGEDLLRVESAFFLLNLEFVEVSKDFIYELENGNIHTSNQGFLSKKTIYKLPPKDV